MAHDFSNFLTVISGFAQFLQAQHRNNPELADGFGEILQAVSRAQEMTEQLAVMGGQRPLAMTACDFHEAIERMAETMQRLVGVRIRIDLRCASTPGPVVRLDPARFEELLTRLCRHAEAELPDGGSVTIDTARLPAEAMRDRPAWLPAGHYVRLSFHGAGAEVDPGLIGRCFEPFFLKLKCGRGTGLGLAVVYALVKQHHGEIEVASGPGAGTTFHLYFPCEPHAATS